MVTIFSKYHGLYTAQFTSKGGTLYTGRGATFADAIFHCLRSIEEYAPYEN